MPMHTKAKKKHVSVYWCRSFNDASGFNAFL
jgi:hypothetical protein